VIPAMEVTVASSRGDGPRGLADGLIAPREPRRAPRATRRRRARVRVARMREYRENARGRLVRAAKPLPQFGGTTSLVESHRGANAQECQHRQAVWQPTHRVGHEALPVGGVPTGTFQPGAALDPRLPVRVLDTTAQGWALVECSNTWQCYVAARGLVPIGGDDG